jgi:hypothetical protein
MVEKIMEIFNVTTVKNLESVALSVSNHLNFHGYDKYTIICPEMDIINFKLKLSGLQKIEIISEETILTFAKFSEICSDVAKNCNRKNFNQKRLGWYYQQVLKITHALESDADFLVMWDADSIPLSKINFFNGDISLSYGSLIEYHNDYFETISEIFKLNRSRQLIIACTENT